MRWSFIIAMTCALCVCSQAAFAQTEVRNDSFDQNQAQRIGTALIEDGEMYAADFVLPQSITLPVELLGVRVVMVADPNKPGTACGRFHLEVYEDANPGAAGPPLDCPIATYEDPGAEIYSMKRQFGAAQRDIAFELRGDPNNYQDLLFSSINNNPQLMTRIPAVMLNTRNVRVGLLAVDNACGLQQGDYHPLMLTDTDGEQGQNFLYGYLAGICPPSATRFYYWKDFAPFFSVTPGDFVMRLLLRAPNMMPPDMGGQDIGMDMMIVDIGPDGSMDMTRVDMATAKDMMGGADMKALPDMRADKDMSANNDQDMKPQPTGGLALTSVSPSSAPTGVSTEIAVLGEGFVSGLELSLDARKIGVVEVKPGRILATVPSGLTPKAYDVIVTNPDGKTALLSGGFTVTSGVSADMGQQDMSSKPGANGAGNSVGEGCGCVQVKPGARQPWWGALLILGLMGFVARRRLG